MNTRSLDKKQKTEWKQKLESFFMFLIIFLPSLSAAILCMVIQPVLTQLLLFFSGWLLWTFIEYFNHRFRMHGAGEKSNVPGYATHINHHHHPTDIRITPFQRRLLLLVNLTLVLFAITVHMGWLTFLTGLYSGFVLYGFMHLILHQRWSGKLFPRLQQFHIHHHCKYPGTCFGVSVTWWDRLLNTAPPEKTTISPRIKEFYFGDHAH